MSEDQAAIQGEDWLFAQLEAEELDVPSFMEWLAKLYDNGQSAQAESSAELIQDTLQERGDTDSALKILQLRASCQSAPSFRKTCETALASILGNAPESRAMIQNIGLDSRVPLAECLRRLDVLRGLTPGVLCYDSTWGAGVVSNVDWFYKRVDIDFETKSGHQMSFAYAGEALTVLTEDHLLFRKHNDTEGLDALIKDDPAEVVRLTLRSFGPMPVAKLQETLVPGILPESGWKSFWDGARKGLKKDPLVDVPTKRSEPLQLLDKEKGYDAEWFAALAGERKMKQVLALVREFSSKGDIAKLTPENMGVLGDRLAFVIKGASGGRHEGLVALAVMAAHDLLVPTELVDAESHLREYLEPKRFLAAVSDIPAREVKGFLAQLKKVDRDGLINLLLEQLTQLQMTALNEAMDLLIEEGRESDCAAIVRDVTVESQTAEVEILYWIQRHPEKLPEWNLGHLSDLALWIVRGLEEPLTGERLKTQNQLRARFEKKEWLETVLDVMDPNGRRELMRWVKDSPAWPTVEKRSVLAFMIKRYPELGDVLSATTAPVQEPVARGPVTSHRSYQERQLQLEKIVTVEIPAVAKEIGVARSYGDLRENFEYKAAKDKQALLLRRQGELEAMLNKVRPTNFEGAPKDHVGQGTGVVLKFADGCTERYYILGVWDRDEELEIISSDSRLAELLIGKCKNDEVDVPAEKGERTCVIEDVLELPDEIRDWMAG